MEKTFDFNEALKECKETYSKEFVSLNILKATVGSNGQQGGDASHGGVTCFKIENLSSTAWNAIAHGENGVEIVLRGDSELETFADALMWAGSVLKSMSKGE